MPKILLPIDVANPHEELVDQLDKLIGLQSSEVRLLYVKEELPSLEHMLGTMANFPDDLSNQLTKKADQVFAQIKSHLSTLGIVAASEIVSGSPAAMITNVAKDEGFDLIAMVPGSHSRIEQHFIGGTTSRVAAHAPNTVLVLRGKALPLERVVIAVDGSDVSLNAAKAAVSLFKLAERDVKVTLVNVVSVVGIYKFISPAQFVASIEDNLVMSGEVALTTAQNELSKLGVESLDIQLKNGDPAGEITELAKTLDAGLIVIGAQGRSAFEKFLLGSVSGRVVTHAQCSTAIIR